MEVNKPDASAVISHGGKQASGSGDSGGADDDHENDDDTREEPRKEAFLVDSSLDGAIPPRIQQMLNDLAGQLEPLRRDIELSQARERELRERLERHPYLPVLNRQGLEHELSRVIGHIHGLGSAAFICVSVENAEHIRRTHGREAYEQAMAHACGLIRDIIGGADIVGCLGGHDLGVLLLAPGNDPVDRLWQKLKELLPTKMFSTGSSTFPLDMAVGGVALESDHTFAQVIRSADTDLMTRSGVRP